MRDDTCLLSYRAWLLRDMAFSCPAQRRSSLSNNCRECGVSGSIAHCGRSYLWSFMRGHLGAGPAQQSKSKLADGRHHQVDSHSSPGFVSGRFGPPRSVIFNLRQGFRRERVLRCVLCVRLLCSSSLLFGQFKDGETPLEAVHVGGGPSRTVLRLQVRVSRSLLVQQETLQRQKTIKRSCSENVADMDPGY